MSRLSNEDYVIISLDDETSAIKIQYYFRKYLNKRNNCVDNVNKSIFNYTNVDIDLSEYASKKNIYRVYNHIDYYKNLYILLISYAVLFLMCK